MSLHDGADGFGDLGDDRRLTPVAAPHQGLAYGQAFDRRGCKRTRRQMIGNREVRKNAGGKASRSRRVRVATV